MIDNEQNIDKSRDGKTNPSDLGIRNLGEIWDETLKAKVKGPDSYGNCLRRLMEALHQELASDPRLLTRLPTKQSKS